jgi:ribosome-binding protein aMBF1 (putative translation factor)
MFEIITCETCGKEINQEHIFKKNDGSIACETCLIDEENEYEYKNMSRRDFMFNK